MPRLSRQVKSAIFSLIKPFLHQIYKGFSRESIAQIYLSGNGIEIGALHCPLPMPRTAHVKYVDLMSVALLRERYPELKSLKLVPVDIEDDGESLGTIQDNTQDFVVANHFIEHCENPVAAFSTMFRVLKQGGVLYLAIPDKRYTFDKDRDVTPLEHVMKDSQEGPSWSRTLHFEDFVRHALGIHHETEKREKIAHLMQTGHRIHYHVWTQTEMLELIMALKKMHTFEIELFLKKGMETIFILRKS